jgi:starch phosphorylase
LTADEVFTLKEKGYDPKKYFKTNTELKRAIDQIAAGFYSGGNRDLFKPLVDSLLERDEYLLFADYQSYCECQEAAEQAYRDEERWTRMSILNCARCGFFSSDRSMRQYCDEIWQVAPVRVEVD